MRDREQHNLPTGAVLASWASLWVTGAVLGFGLSRILIHCINLVTEKIAAVIYG